MSHCTRRRFLEDSILAAAMAAAFPASQALAASKKKPVRPKKSPSELLHVAIVGAGGRGGEHIGQFLDNPDTEITYIVDADINVAQKKAERVAKAQGGRMPKVVQDMRKAFDDKSVDIVSTATPNHWHALTAIWAMQAGKDVYVEKPASYCVSEGRRMVQVARKYNRVCQVGTQCRSMKGTLDAIDYVKSGKIGEVNLARGICYRVRNSIGPKGNYPVPPEVDYNLWCGPARMLPNTRQKFHYDWHWQREWGNGDMGNQGPHQMDIARWGLGINRVADSAIAYGGRLGYEDAGDVANTEVGIFEADGKTIVFEVRGRKSDPLRGAIVGVIFYGSKGSVVLTKYTTGAAFDPQGNLIVKFEGDGDHFGNFVDAVRARNPKLLHCDILEGHLSCAHSHLANVSYYLGKKVSVAEIRAAVSALKTHEDVNECLDRTVAYLQANGVDLDKTPLTMGPMLKIDPKTETVIGNPAANALLARQPRAPFVVPTADKI
jgi:predicted dehydrogenase